MSAAIRTARDRSRAKSPTSEPGMCLREVRECYGVGPRAEDAAEAWAQAKHKHPETDPRKIPRGVPVFWTGGSGGHGHIAIATGYRGRCLSTDILRSGFFDKVPIELVEEKWGLELVGWTEDLNGVRVWSPPVRDLTPNLGPVKKTTAKPRKKTTTASKGETA